MTVDARRATAWSPLAPLALVTLGAWLLLLRLDTTATRPAAFLAGWATMMTAMMLPSTAPLVLTYGRRGRGRLLLGYLLAWVALGVPVYLLASAVDLMDVPTAWAAGVLFVAAAYQFTPAKDVCLRACRSPLDFIALRWGRGAFRLGLDHGLYCIGCCWALMAVLVVAAAMNIAIAAALAAVVFVEKVVPAGEWTARLTGAALVIAGIAIVL